MFSGRIAVSWSDRESYSVGIAPTGLHLPCKRNCTRQRSHVQTKSDHVVIPHGRNCAVWLTSPCRLHGKLQGGDDEARCGLAHNTWPVSVSSVPAAGIDTFAGWCFYLIQRTFFWKSTFVSMHTFRKSTQEMAASAHETAAWLERYLAAHVLTGKVIRCLARLHIVGEAAADDLNPLGRLIDPQALVVLHHGGTGRDIVLNHHTSAVRVEVHQPVACVDRDDLQ